MAQESSGFVQRGLVLLGLMLILVTVVVFVLFRPPEAAPLVGAEIAARQPSTDGWEVRYNATVAQARRSSKLLACLVLAEMLDERQQLRNYLVKTPEGQDVIDEQAARRTVVNGLKALSLWLKNKDALPLVARNPLGWPQVVVAVEALTHSDNAVLREEAEAVKKLLAETK
jgi:hypothetical protein